MANLSAALGLRSGLVIGASFGGLLGGWLGLGGRKRAAALAGHLVGLVGVVAVMRMLRPFAWVLDVIMEGVFGEIGSAFSPALVVFILIFSGRPIIRRVSSGIFTLLSRPKTTLGEGAQISELSIRSDS